MKKILYAIALFILLSIPETTKAHVKWFVDESGTYTNQKGGDSFFYLTVWFLISLFLVLAAIFLERYLSPLKKETQYKLNSVKHKATSVFTVLIGVFFLVAAYKGFLFSMNVSDLGLLQHFFIVLEAIIGINFIVGFGVRTSSILLFSLWSLAFVYAGPLLMLENIWVVGVSLFILIHGRAHFKVVKKHAFTNDMFMEYDNYAMPILRFFLGLDLLILGFTEKILRPELGLVFLEEHNWNFMQHIGFENYSDYLFVISAGAVESIFGLIFLLGTITRVNAVVIAIFFTIPVFVLGPIELFGHLPHFLMVILLILFGSGEKLKLINKQASS